MERTIRRMCILALSALLGLNVFVRSGWAAEPSRKPNILIVLADDMGFSDLGCYGGEIHTPNLDELAGNGLRFTQFYNTARCWPSRAALLTGYYAQQVRRDTVPGVASGSKGVRPAWAPLLPELLRPLGYRSYHSGKWHIDGRPLDNGFDHSYLLQDLGRYFRPRVHFKDDRKLPPVQADAGYYSTVAIADYAIEFLKEHAERFADKPFFHYVAFNAPHFPLQALPEDIARYRDTYRRGWDTVRQERWQRMKKMGIIRHDLPALERDVGPPYHFPEALKQFGPDEINRPLPWGELTEKQQAFQSIKMAIHAAMIDRLDREMGRILRQLRVMGALDNTLILVLSDNGASAEMMVRDDGHDPKAAPGSAATHLCIGPGWSSTANTPLRRHKTWVHEGGISTPLIFHWPKGISARGELRHNPGHLIDMVPTLLELAGGKVPAMWKGKPVPHAPGKSLVPVLTKDNSVSHDYLWWCHEGNRAVRVGDWKLVAAGAKGPWELYDLKTDRGESHSLAEKRPEKKRKLETIWTQRYREFCDLALKGAPAAAPPPKSPPASSNAGKSLAGPRERDSWLAYLGAGKRCGFLHTRVTRLEKGQFLYIVEQRLLIDLLGVGKEEITNRREYVVTSAYRPVSLQSEGRQASGVTRARGTVRDGKLEVTALRAGMERTRKVELPNNVIFEHCLEDWLRDRPKDFQAGEVLLLDDELWDIQRAAVKRRGSPQSERVWEVDRGPGVGTVTYVYSADGTLREIKGPLAPIFLKPCSAEEAKSISYYKMVGRELLDFPLNKEIGRVDQLTELTIRLSWAGIPFDRFQLEDERQHVVQRSEEDGRFQAVVRIGRQKAVSDSLPLPVRDPKFAPYLAETRFIKPRDPKIAETARRIVPSKASTLEAARALSAWVATTVKPELIAETLTGPEVLDCKRGKCSEYAILFASMARSIGLPTRIVLGQRLAGGRWGGHMWNEVYAGRWLTVDAGVNEVGDSPALLKLTHSDTVDGTQPLRRDLTHSLSVSVDDFKSQTRLKGKFTTGIDKGVYTNATFGCRVRVPIQEWTMEDLSKPGVATVRFRVPKEDDVHIHFAAFALPVPLKTVTDARIKIYKDYKLVKDEEHKVGDLKGRLLRFERSKDGKKLILTEILWVKDSTGFIVNMLAEAAAHDKHEANFRKIVSSFEQLPSEK